MTLKLHLDDISDLDDGQKALYVKDEKTGGYRLNIDPADIPDVDGLKNKVQELLDEKKTEQRKREEEQRRREDAERERAKKDGDLETLENSWKERLATETGQLRTEADGYRSQLEQLTVGRAATEMAADLAVVTNGVSSAKALLPHIERRLKLETGTDGVARVRVLDAAGQISAMTVEQLKAEFRADPVFSPLIRANGAGGGGADGNKNNNGGGAAKKFGEMNEAERVQLHRNDPAEFKRLKAEHDQSNKR